MTAEEGARFIDEVATTFNEIWLEQKPPRLHRLQAVWQRPDFLSTLELLVLGRAIAAIRRTDPGWVAGQAKAIRKSDGGSHGPLFEILICGMLAGGGSRVTPMPKKTPGFDAEIGTDSGLLRVSIKNHDISSHEAEFRSRCALLHSTFKRTRVETGLPTRMRVQATEPMEQRDFDAIRQALAAAGTGEPVEVVPGRVSIRIDKVSPDPARPFALDQRSHQLTVLSPQHPNEQRKFSSRVMDACRNMKQHCRPKVGTANVVLMRLHATAQLDQVRDVARAQVNDPESGVDAIYFYQPSITRSNGLSHLTHHFCAEGSPRFRASNQRPQFNVFHGNESSEPHRLELQSPDTGQSLDLTGNYFYQVGEIFYEAQPDAQGRLGGPLRSPAHGVHEHIVASVQGGRITLAGLFPQHEELLLL